MELLNYSYEIDGRCLISEQNKLNIFKTELDDILISPQFISKLINFTYLRFGIDSVALCSADLPR